MSHKISDPLPATQFSKLEEVARRQRRLTRMNALVAFIALAAAAASMLSLVGCASGGDDPVQSAIDSMNSGDDDAIDASFSPDAKQELIRLNAAAGPRPLRYRLVHVERDSSHATLAATPDAAVEARYLVELDFVRNEGIVERLAFSPLAARW